ncbi:TetR/AcrR family transcriptional regulator [Niveispirillum irakense]|uniref:TetR/AcrR family transcriptional regulator n=1 Tax=Niveispirillum irakense TaxID=34011 RepID=UPI00042A8A96|nr:TetR/AcrR family transcriptional regulator [Niveispirillum irakense]
MSRIEPEKVLVYSSPAIHARRRRILEETRKLIAERGLIGFSMDEICKRADVSKRTLYNAFQTKERMIAMAIHEYFERYISRLPYSSPAGTLQRNVERMVFVIQRNRQIRNYISAIMSIYFSLDADSDIWTTMHSMAVTPNLQWIEALKARRQLQPWIDAQRLADDVVRFEYAIIYDWCRGHIADDAVIPHLLTTCLTLMSGATRGAARKEIEAVLDDIREGRLPLAATSAGTPATTSPPAEPELTDEVV